jgi:hypothetical protein
VTLLAALLEPERWTDFVDEYAAANPRRHEKSDAYRAVVCSGEAARVAADAVAGRHVPEPPAEALVNKADGRKKRVFQFPPRDELLFKIVNRLVQPVAAAATSPLCHSFLPGSGARVAFRSLLRDPDLDGKDCFRLDVRDYFNSIDVEQCLGALPPAMADDAPLRVLLERTLRNPLVRRPNGVHEAGPKGVMAGTPLAPVLANLHLTDVDDHFARAGVTYSRYSDDIIVFGTPGEIDAHERDVRAALASRGLRVNEAKSGRSLAGAPWEYLGFRCALATIDLSTNTRRKLRAKTTRLARKLDRQRRRWELTPAEVVAGGVRRINRSLYGIPRDGDGFCWATWFFPLLTTDASLVELDAHIQHRLRFAATGSHRARARKTIGHDELRAAGYVPLVSAYWAYRRGPAAYAEMLAARGGGTNAGVPT